ncbi:MAG TPA: hypothetical protein VGN75_11125 [Kaistia sp.]|nr:hypothetical protein [Kaistia sp.]
MAVKDLLKTILPGHAARTASKEKSERLDKELKESFPTSDPPGMVQPGSGITGAEVKPSKLSPSQLAKGKKP